MEFTRNIERVNGGLIYPRATALENRSTAAADKPGAEALSGLARAIFYAGARALLVSHWPVESETAVKLMTTIFASIAKNPRLTMAETLRQAMLATMTDRTNPDWANPTFWAPFVLVGDGGVMTR